MTPKVSLKSSRYPGSYRHIGIMPEAGIVKIETKPANSGHNYYRAIRSHLVLLVLMGRKPIYLFANQPYSKKLRYPHPPSLNGSPQQPGTEG